uniref:Interleukin-1 n=1 Tax=Seriola lalandi dorsalis TaxID=1841481 RepID=A0A3B4YQG8_SERLL
MKTNQTDGENGGVVIVHQIQDGKHQYEVGNVVKYKNATGEKMFVRRGDKLMQINGVDLQLLTPEELAQMLADGNPMLKVHKAAKVKEHNEQPSSDADTLHPVSMESTTLRFSMEMRREEENEVEEDGNLQEDVCEGETMENGEKTDLLIVTMKKTSVSVVKGRACNPGSPCQGCNGIGCSYNDVVMVAESSTVTLVARGSTFKKDKVERENVSVVHVATHQYLRGLCSQKTIYASPNPEKITIYHYKSTIMGRSFKGIPVVLNFTGSNCFLRCCKEGETVFLQVETCEKQKLKQISKSDESTLSFVFYMKTVPSNRTKFESVLHRGWFIQILNTDSVVRMQTLDGQQEEHTFLFIIQK